MEVAAGEGRLGPLDVGLDLGGEVRVVGDREAGAQLRDGGLGGHLRVGE